MADLPGRAAVVIVGGGIVGCSVAYHLVRRGCADVVLLERKQLTCGTTWHAAGLLGQLRATHNLTRLAQYTTGLYASLEAETGQATGFKQRGSISVARTPERIEELLRGASMASCFGLEVETLAPADVARLWPSRAPTTSSARSSCRRTGRPIRSTPPRRSPGAPGRRACASSRTRRSSASSWRAEGPSACAPRRGTSAPTSW